MATVTELIQKFESIDVRGSIVAAFTETEQEYIYFNLDQLAKGNRSDDTKTARKGAKYYPYSDVTVQLKLQFGEGLGAITDRVTLYETGAFYGGFFSRVEGDNILTSSVDPKAYLLEFHYGKEIFGVSKGNKKLYVFGPFWSVLKPKLGI